jgi:hypothetical protein
MWSFGRIFLNLTLECSGFSVRLLKADGYTSAHASVKA